MPPVPRPQYRLATVVFTVIAFAAIALSCFVGGLAAEYRTVDLLDSGGFDGVEPPAHREDGAALLVCSDDAEDFAERNDDVDLRRIENERLYEDCLANGHRDLASAVAAAAPGSRILVLPGRYDVAETILLDGAADLQIEGLGDGPEAVLFTAGFALDHVLAARNATGLYLKGFTVGQARESGLRLDEVSSAAVESVAVVESGGHGFHVTDSTGIALTGCRAAAADDAGIAIEASNAIVQDCEAEGNVTGLLTTGGGRIDIDGNRLHGNTTGLAVTETGTTASVTATGNLVYANNTGHYDRLGTGACTDPADRDWSEGLLCPERTVPRGVGILLADAGQASVTGNRIWNQDTAAIAAWGTPGAYGGAGDVNTFADNTFGVRDDGQRERNRLDLWWDGTGSGNCFDEPNAFRTLPAALPDCEDGAGASRIAGDPLRALKVRQCGLGDAAAGVPGGCDWFGARFTDRLEFQAAVVFAAALLFLTGAGWLAAARTENPPRAGRMTFSAMATGAGGLLLVLAVWSGRADYEALAIGLWGVGWLLGGRSWRQCGMPFFGLFTGLIGAVAVVDAVDRAVWTLPFVPVSPGWIWVVLLPLWTLAALSLAFGPRRREEERPEVERTPVTAPSNDRWDW
ncbi:right-handed parallel beta-helix repeat-containing protein [Glycomyces luteolus]|uniref:Right-handed parallel beta-helix repeat-containing protein n=1 Tax=Glycomyces luteolus TaxID=2670330 RepID=A0A9X3PEH3_9ACTN|nr:right-handed parallel beta-helix repeat-containing protein [Glycomyces luteolus]MDA1362010.1 right-handed parallel beta-helix repeat-containing protein [Glycomyces luteolus]